MKMFYIFVALNNLKCKRFLQRINESSGCLKCICRCLVPNRYQREGEKRRERYSRGVYDTNCSHFTQDHQITIDRKMLAGAVSTPSEMGSLTTADPAQAVVGREFSESALGPTKLASTADVQTTLKCPSALPSMVTFDDLESSNRFSNNDSFKVAPTMRENASDSSTPLK